MDLDRGGPDIVLHIGAPKTGSTYLQRRVRASREALRRQGVYIPILPQTSKMAGNAKLLPIALDGRARPAFRRGFPDIDPALLSAGDVVSELTRGWRAGTETLLLSAENFRIRHIDPLKRLLPGGYAVRVVLCVRRQDAWANSYYNQLVKSGSTTEPFQVLIDRLCKSAAEPDLYSPDWLEHYSAWRHAFGECHVVAYVERGAELTAAFLEAVGLSASEALSDIPRQQSSLDIFQLAYLLDRDHANADDHAGRRAACSKASRQRATVGKACLLTPANRQRLRDRFTASNRELAAVLGRPELADALAIACESPEFCDMERLYRSQDYARYKRLADEIYRDHHALKESRSTASRPSSS